jgi:1-acyl-sn-glycerol-3-phosphate acyltransferase
VAPAANIPLRASLWRCRILRIAVPRTVQWLLRKLLAPFGAAAPIDQIEALRYPSTVDASKVRDELGFAPTKSSLRAAREARGPLSDEQWQAQWATSADGGEPHYDPYGLDKGYIARLSTTLFKFLHDLWWRVEVKDQHHLPAEGPVVLVGVHRGFQPWDGVMAMYHIARETGRYIRFLVHPTLVKFPFLAPYMIKMGGIHACQESGDWVLENGGILAIFPEGIRGAFRPYGKDIYQLGKFGRNEYIRFALKHQATVVPFVTVGSAEIFPVLAKWRWSWWKRLLEWPCFPITPTMGTVPLPSKWHTLYLEPVRFDHPPEAADDPEIVRQLGRQVKARMAAALGDLVRRRRHIFWGRLWSRDELAA